jgi:hypothetical protein
MYPTDLLIIAIRTSPDYHCIPVRTRCISSAIKLGTFDVRSLSLLKLLKVLLPHHILVLSNGHLQALRPLLPRQCDTSLQLSNLRASLGAIFVPSELLRCCAT